MCCLKLFTQNQNHTEVYWLSVSVIFIYDFCQQYRLSNFSLVWSNPELSKWRFCHVTYGTKCCEKSCERTKSFIFQLPTSILWSNWGYEDVDLSILCLYYVLLSFLGNKQLCAEKLEFYFRFLYCICLFLYVCLYWNQILEVQLNNF